MSEITSTQAKEYPWRVLIEYVCDHCGGGFSSTKPSPKFCSQDCYIEDSRERFSESAKSLWADPEFKIKIQEARRKAGYPDPNRPEQVIRRRLRSACKNTLRRCLKVFGTFKSGRTYDLLGYSADDLRLHIESLFLPGMSWENYGDWEIDHIHPISKFPPSTPLSEVNALSNLQPLWKSDNRKKRDQVLQRI